MWTINALQTAGFTLVKKLEGRPTKKWFWVKRLLNAPALIIHHTQVRNTLREQKNSQEFFHRRSR